jgi:hypothetical protein
MKNKLFITIISLTISLTLVSTVSAQTAVPGVYKNETFNYTYDLFWTSTNPSSLPPSFFIALNETEQVQIKISEVSGSKIDLTVTEHYRNGTQHVDSGNIDISTGVIEAPYGYLIISANLNVGQRLYPLGGHQEITSTYLKSYPTGQRETNQYVSPIGIEEVAIDFDKIKGIAISYTHELVETSSGYTTTITEVLTNTNSDVWTVAPTPTATPTSSTTSPASTATPSVTQTPAPSSVIPEFSLLMVPLLLAAASVVLLIGKRAKLPFKL